MNNYLNTLDNINFVNFKDFSKFSRFRHVRVHIVGKIPVEEAPKNYYCPTQVHGSRVHIVKSLEDRAVEADACITLKTQTPIAVRTADCLPVLLFSDTQDSPVASVHAGWKGLCKGIISEALIELRAVSNNNKAVNAFIGPAISRANFEIGPEVLHEIASSQLLEENEFLHCTEKGVHDRWHFDLQQAAALHLVRLGLEPQNITVIRECTVEEEKWYSYRGEKPLSGHNFTIIEKV